MRFRTARGFTAPGRPTLKQPFGVESYVDEYKILDVLKTNRLAK